MRNGDSISGPRTSGRALSMSRSLRVPDRSLPDKTRGSSGRLPCGPGAVAIGLIAAGLAVTAAAAQTGPYTPAQGSPERKAIVDTLRLPVSRMLKGPVAFAITYLKVHRKWALLIAVPRRPNGEAVDYADTKWADKVRQMDFKDEIVALMRQRGTRWRVVWYEIGREEPPWGDWAKRYRAPEGIFPKIERRSPFE